MKQFFLLLTGILLLNQGSYAQVPTITAVTPTAGPIGSQVIITGTNFNATAANNTVYFGAVKAVVSTATSTSLSVTVPFGASFEHISVTTGNLIAIAANPFIVTYPGGGGDFSASTFAAAANLSGAGNLTAADFDADGKTDLGYTDFSGNSFTILRNTSAAGASVFSSASFTITGLVNPVHIKAADMDGDGMPELVMPSETGNAVYVIKNNSTPGTLSFGSKTAYGVGSSPRQVAFADLDADGKLDFIVSNSGSSNITVMINMSSAGSISFGSFNLATLSTPEGVATGDLNADGKPDIAVTSNVSAGNVSVFLNNTTSSLAFSPRIDYSTGANSFPWNITIADLDGDGKPELLNTNLGPNSVSVFRNTSSGSYSLAAPVFLATTSSPRGLAIGDINADGKPDLVTANYFSSSNFSALKNNSTTGTISFADYVSFPAGNGTGNIVLADMNNDGLLDVITANSASGSLSYFRNQLSVITSVSFPFENASRLQLHLSPNPAKGLLMITHPKEINKKAVIRITDATGKIIDQQQANQNNSFTVITTEKMLPGIYFVSWYNGKKLYSSELIIH